MAIYAAFRELLIAPPEKSDDGIRALFRKATIARYEVRFLLEGDPKLQTCLEQLIKQVDIVSMDAMRRAGLPMNAPRTVQDMMNKAIRLGAAKLEISRLPPSTTAPGICRFSEAHRFFKTIDRRVHHRGRNPMPTQKSHEAAPAK